MIPTDSKPSFSPPQQRILGAALELFGKHGIHATSLQMIANEIGVTKAAVYHQFRTKDEIVIAATGIIVNELAELLEQAAVLSSAKQRRKFVVSGLISIAVKYRHSAAFLQRDPDMLRIFDEYEPFRRIMTRIDETLTGNNDSEETRVSIALFISALAGSVAHPLVKGVSDEILHQQLQRLLFSLLKAAG